MGDITWIEMVLFALASFRLTRLIVRDIIMEWLRKPFIDLKTGINEKGEEEEWVVPKGLIGEGLTCQWCVGIWSSVVLVGLFTFVPYGEMVILMLAIAGIQSLIYEGSERYL